MDTVKLLLENQLIMIAFAFVLFLAIFGTLGVYVVPKYFNNSQIAKILKTANFVSFLIALLLGLIFLYNIEGNMSENLDFINFDSWTTKVGLGIFIGSILMWFIFEGAEDNLKKKSNYHKFSLVEKIVTGLALVIGVVGLFGMKLIDRNYKSYDFYDEELVELGEEEER